MRNLDSLLTTITVLSETIAQQQLKCESLRGELDSALTGAMEQAVCILKLNNHIDSITRTMEEERETHMNYQTTLMWEINTLKNELRTFREEAHKVSAEEEMKVQLSYFNTLGVSHPLINYIITEGRTMWEKGERIATIKKVREFSGWDLRQAKNFCWAFEWDKPLACEEDEQKVGAELTVGQQIARAYNVGIPPTKDSNRLQKEPPSYIKDEAESSGESCDISHSSRYSSSYMG